MKKEPVLIISAICAIISMFFVPPSAAYMGYIDWKVLALLFCLMAVVAGFSQCGLFDVMGQKLLKRCSGTRTLRFVLIMLPFFTSMLITNDVALITFVPFAISVLCAVNRERDLIPVIVFQTVAANLGSMATPVGNPQSLFLYNSFSIPAAQYFFTIAPFAAVSLIALAGASVLCRNEPIAVSFGSDAKLKSPWRMVIFSLLFVLSMLCVLHIIDYRPVLAAVVIALLIFDRPIFAKIDYGLLVTFVCFFIFSGNLGNIPSVRSTLAALLEKSTMLTSAIASQAISNVPAAVLLAGFTDDWRGLLIGTNIGGLGTIIASLASLISFKYYAKCDSAKPIKYIAVFTLVNVIGLATLIGLAYIL